MQTVYLDPYGHAYVLVTGSRAMRCWVGDIECIAMCDVNGITIRPRKSRESKSHKGEVERVEVGSGGGRVNTFRHTMDFLLV